MNILGQTDNNFTFYSESHSTTYWLDHCLSTVQGHNTISSVNILHDFHTSDHFPISVALNIDNLPYFDPEVTKTKGKCIWYLADEDSLKSYYTDSNELLSKIVLPNSLLHCNNMNCDSLQHKHYINSLFNEIVSCLSHAAVCNISHSSVDNVNIKKIITLFNVYEIRKVIDSLEKGQSGGLDNLSAEHLLYAGQRLDIMLSLLFNLCIVLVFLPDHLISSVLIPIVKDKSGDVMDKGNYRPIALSSVISKVLEVLLLDRMEYYLFTSDNQFGFKSKHSTDQCIYILKKLIEFYMSHNSPMYLCFLDASKAFDLVNHWTMFKKLLLRGVPPILVRLMLFWHRSQQILVRWGSATSTSFKVLNGVRQGGILSPILFNVYIDDLSYELSKCKSGCIIDNKIVNHIAYANDLIVFCPSIKGFQKLLDICDSYGNTHDIKYNQKKLFVC